MLRVCGRGKTILSRALADLREREDFNSLGIPDLLNYMISAGERVQVQYINGHWLDINNLEDLQRANEFTQGRQS